MSSGCGCGAPVSKGCGCAAPVPAKSCCETPCAPARRCCPPVLPQLVNCLDSTLHKIFSNPCNIPCCRPRPCRPSCATAWHGYEPSCGCEGQSLDNWSPHNSNPFIEDELQVPPPAPKDARVKHIVPKALPVHHNKSKAHRTATVTPSVPRVEIAEASSTPASPSPEQVLHERAVQEKVLGAKVTIGTNRLSAQKSSPIQTVRHEEPAKRTIPNNPLRP